jgi:hypothetical protein
MVVSNVKTEFLPVVSARLVKVNYVKVTQVAKNHFAFATALLWH